MSRRTGTRMADQSKAPPAGHLGTPFACLSCGRPYPDSGHPFRCPHCGGVYDFLDRLPYQPAAKTPVRGLDRYRSWLSWLGDNPLVSLGEGGTPLVAANIGQGEKLLKCEQLNPTGSFKDRGTAVLVSALAAGGVTQAIEDSSGNAGASFAAYAARAGIRARIFAPSYASGPKRAQIEAYGADLVLVDGPRAHASEAALQEAEAGAVYASHAFLPHGLAGMATLAFELVEQLGRAPGTVITPVGQGTLYLGVHRGFKALNRAGRIDQLPAMVGVQSNACAPVWSAWSGSEWQPDEVDTLAEGIRIAQPLRMASLLDAAEESDGGFEVVDDDSIRRGLAELGRVGVFVEPTSAVVWEVLERADDRWPGPWVAVLTGSGMKSPPVLA
jgi:threonine synthase